MLTLKAMASGLQRGKRGLVHSWDRIWPTRFFRLWLCKAMQTTACLDKAQAEAFPRLVLQKALGFASRQPQGTERFFCCWSSSGFNQARSIDGGGGH